MSVVWCVARVWIKAPSGRQRFNVLGAIDAVSKEVITVVNSAYIISISVCALLARLAASRPSLPITVVLDNARYQRCALVKTCAGQLNIELLFLPTYHGKFVFRPVSRFGVAERVFRHAQIVKDEADVAVKVGHFLRDAGFSV